MEYFITLDFEIVSISAPYTGLILHPGADRIVKTKRAIVARDVHTGELWTVAIPGVNPFTGEPWTPEHLYDYFRQYQHYYMTKAKAYAGTDFELSPEIIDAPTSSILAELTDAVNEMRESAGHEPVSFDAMKNNAREKSRHANAHKK